MCHHQAPHPDPLDPGWCVAAIVDMEAHHSKSAIDSAQWRRKINTYSNTKAKMQKKFAAPSVEL